MNNPNKRLGLNRSCAMLGGVCAGIANYFDLSITLVRVLTVIAVFLWPPTVAVYIIAWFCLSDNRTELTDSVANSKVGRHFRHINYSKGLYKSRHNKRISGVCAGIANYLEVNPFWIRLATVLSLFFGPFAIFAYIVAAIVMDPEPVGAGGPTSGPDGYDRDSDRSSYRRRAKRDAYSSTKDRYESDDRIYFSKRRLRECSDKFGRLENRLRNLEATITSKKFKLHSEFKRMST